MNENPLPPADDDDDEPASIRSMDAELRMMGKMLRMLNKLPEKAQGRVVAWLQDRFMVGS